MRKWNDPKVWVLGVQYTNEDAFQDVSLLSSWRRHACHRQPEEHNGNCSSGNGHVGIETGKCSIHTETVYTDNTGEEYSCCCLS